MEYYYPDTNIKCTLNNTVQYYESDLHQEMPKSYRNHIRVNETVNIVYLIKLKKILCEKLKARVIWKVSSVFVLKELEAGSDQRCTFINY